MNSVKNAIELLKEFNIKEGLKNFNLPIINKVSTDNRVSKHILLTFSGYTSEKDNSQDSWGSTAKYF